MTSKTKNWILALGYVAFIYATLSVVRAPIEFLRNKGVLVISLNTLYGMCAGVLLAVLVRFKGLQWWRLCSFAGIFLAYFLISQQVFSPEEKIHFLQYGLVGVFFVRALKPVKGPTKKSYAGALVLSGLAGWLDEIIQGMLPTRHYDVNDIFLNIASAFLGLLIFALLPPFRKSNNQ